MLSSKLSLVLLPLLAVMTAGNPQSLQALTEANNKFGAHMMAQLSPHYHNVVISPYSLHVVLSMTSLGAMGDTLQEMLHVLQSSNVTDMHMVYNHLISSFNTTMDLMSANGLFYHPNYTIEQDFMDNATDWYHGTVHHLDTMDAEASINEWAANHTHDMIQDLVAPDSVPSSSVLVLASTMYFNGSWARPLSDPVKANFSIDDDNMKEVHMLADTHSYKVKFTDEYDVLRVPFEGDRFALYIALVNDSAALLNPACLPDHYEMEFFEGLEDKLAEIHIPHFEINFRTSLKDTLKSLGMEKAFTAEAELSGISNGSHISDVMQRVVVQVTQHGMGQAMTSPVNTTENVTAQVSFKADRPFLYFLRDDDHGEILLQGKFANPQDDPTAIESKVSVALPTCQSSQGGYSGGASGRGLSALSWLLPAACSMLGYLRLTA